MLHEERGEPQFLLRLALLRHVPRDAGQRDDRALLVPAHLPALGEIGHGAVADHSELHLVRLVALDRPVGRRIDGVQVVRMDAGVEHRPGSLAAARREAVVRRRRLVPGDVVGGDLPLPGADTGGAQDEVQPVVALLEREPGGPPLTDVAEGDDGPLQLPVLQQRSREVLDGEAGAVLPPQHLVVDAALQALRVGKLLRTLAGRVRRAVLACVVDRLVDPDAAQLLGGPAEHLLGGGVHERHVTLAVHAEDAVAGRLEQVPAARLGLGELAIGALARRHVPQHALHAAHVAGGVTIEVAGDGPLDDAPVPPAHRDLEVGHRPLASSRSRISARWDGCS